MLRTVTSVAMIWLTFGCDVPARSVLDGGWSPFPLTDVGGVADAGDTAPDASLDAGPPEPRRTQVFFVPYVHPGLTPPNLGACDLISVTIYYGEGCEPPTRDTSDRGCLTIRPPGRILLSSFEPVCGMPGSHENPRGRWTSEPLEPGTYTAVAGNDALCWSAGEGTRYYGRADFTVTGHEEGESWTGEGGCMVVDL